MIQHQNNTLKKDNKIILASSEVIRVGNNCSKSLNDYFKKLQYDMGCTYIFYIYEDTLNDRKVIYSSNWKWQNLLVGEKLINDCPVFKAASEGLSSNKNSILLPWNHIHCKTSKEKDITLLRVEYNIANGIGISHKDGYHREGIGFGGDITDVNFYQRMIADNLIYNIMKKIRLLVLNRTHYHQPAEAILH